MKSNKRDDELEEVTPGSECEEEETSAQEIPAEAAEEAAEQTQEEMNQEEEVQSEETQTETEKTPIVEGKLTAGKIALLVALVVAAIAVVVALVFSGLSGKGSDDANTETTAGAAVSESTVPDDTVSESTQPSETTEATIPADGNPDDVTCKGSYTATDDEIIAAKDTVVARIGDAELTIGELQIYYWANFYDFMNNYGSYASYYGLDYTQPLDTQLYMDGSMTWQQYFLSCALDTWHVQVALGMTAEEEGFEMGAQYTDYLANLASDIEESAVSYGFENGQAMLESEMGKGVDMDDYVSFIEESYLYSAYIEEQTGKITLTDDEVESYFTENAATYESDGITKTDDQIYVDARHILVMPQGGTTDDSGNTTYSEEEWETCRASAQAILDEWMAGEATEESFAALANSYSEDPGSNTNGGLYENIYEGQMVEPFQTWCFDSSRQYGDTGLVKTDYGYHVMYFVGSTPVWYATAKNDLYTEKYTKIITDAQTAHEITVDYSAILLNTKDFSTAEG